MVEFCNFDDTLTCRKCGRSVVAAIRPVFRDCARQPMPVIDYQASVQFAPGANQPDPRGVADSRDFFCQHRGEVLEKVNCGGCGLRTEIAEVHHCKKHGKCTIHARAIRTNGPASPLVAVCISCPDRQADAK